jgi:hypothetical protein
LRLSELRIRGDAGVLRAELSHIAAKDLDRNSNPPNLLGRLLPIVRVVKIRYRLEEICEKNILRDV